MQADLHVHSTASDGTLAPSRLVELAAAAGLDVLSITDHDTVEGVGPAIEAGERHGVTVVPGVELSSWLDGTDCHILGYFIDHTSSALTERLLELRHDRLERAVQMVESLSEAGYDIGLDDVLQLASGGSVGRAHIARALVESGAVTSVSDAFDRLIGRKGPFYVRKRLSTPADAVRLIKDAGGVAVCAHPAVGGVERLLPDLIREGLGGIEAFHPEHAEEDRDRLASLARERGLLVTGGTDFHGPGGPGPALGSMVPPAEDVARMMEAAGR